MDIQLAAGSLLLLRIISDLFLLRVMSIQYPLLRAENDPQLKMLRYILFSFALLVFLGNAIPIVIDIATLMTDVDRTRVLSNVSVAYAFSNAVTSVNSAIFFWLIYKVTGQATLKIEAENRTLQSENDQLHKDAK